MHNDTTDNEDGEIHMKRLPPDVIPVQATEHMLEESPPYMNGDVSERESPAETDSSEDMNMAPHRPIPPPPPSKYTDREDMVRSACTGASLLGLGSPGTASLIASRFVRVIFIPLRDYIYLI